jgi:predicted DNA-binding transcriptional regulator AlpA
MEQVHKRFTAEQVKVLLKGYCQGTLDRPAVEEILGISKTRFFTLLRQYRQDRDNPTLAYRRSTSKRLSAWVEGEIEKELMLDKDLIDDSTLPITGYNYAAIRDRLARRGVTVSSPTIIARAKSLGCYQPHPRKKVHDREVVTTAIGALIQHDASHHRWSPYAKERGF